jgi:hypothetical protein
MPRGQDHSNDTIYSKEHWRAIDTFLIDYARLHAPVTVRQLFYACSVAALVAKTEHCYVKIQGRTVKLRRAGDLDWAHIVDGTRATREPLMYDSIAEGVDSMLSWLRLDPWTSHHDQIQIWLEKDALAGVIEPVTREYGVPLFVARGYSSVTFLHDAAERIARSDKPAFVYHLGDFDPSGVDASRVLEKTLREFARGSSLSFERVAVTEEQIDEMSLPTRPTKSSDPRAAKFDGDASVELDAIPPDDLRAIVRDVIERHITASEIERFAIKARRQAAVIRRKLA